MLPLQTAILDSRNAVAANRGNSRDQKMCCIKLRNFSPLFKCVGEPLSVGLLAFAGLLR